MVKVTRELQPPVASNIARIKGKELTHIFGFTIFRDKNQYIYINQQKGYTHLFYIQTLMTQTGSPVTI